MSEVSKNSHFLRFIDLFWVKKQGTFYDNISHYIR